MLAARVAGLDLYVLDAPHLFARPGNPYVGPDGTDWPDNALRFAALAEVRSRNSVADSVDRLRPGCRPARLAGRPRSGLSCTMAANRGRAP